MFLDSDDALLPGALASLHMKLRTSDKPVVRGLGSLLCMQRQLVVTPDGTKDSGAVQEFGPPSGSFCFHMYKTDFLRKNGILFPEDTIMGEDRVFLCRLYALLSEIPTVSRRVYLYRINHKRFRPSAASALSFVLYQLRARAAFEQQNRVDWVAPYLKQTFLPLWLQWLHAAREEGQEQALEFLDLCRVLVAGLESDLLPPLSQQLGTAAPAFLRRLEAGDTTGMLALLEHSRLLIPHPAYLGIDRETQGLPWLVYRALSWIRNTLCSPGTWPTHCYLLRLRLPVLRRRPATAAEPAERQRQRG